MALPTPVGTSDDGAVEVTSTPSPFAFVDAGRSAPTPTGYPSAMLSSAAAGVAAQPSASAPAVAPVADPSGGHTPVAHASVEGVAPDSATAVDGQASAPMTAEAVLEVVEWKRRVQEQREMMETATKSRIDLRSAVENLQQRLKVLTSENERLASGDTDNLEARRASLEAKATELRATQASTEQDLEARGAEKAQLETAVQNGAVEVATLTKESDEEQKRRSKLEEQANTSDEQVAAAKERLKGMVAVDKIQQSEQEAQNCKEALKTLDREARQLRMALADALNGADLPMVLQELEVLRNSAEAAKQRQQGLEAYNAQLETAIAKLEHEIKSLRRWSVDCRQEEDLMREVIMQQSEKLSRKVEDLAEERKTAVEDREQLLETVGNVLTEVEEGEARIERRQHMESECNRLELADSGLIAEVERLRRTNDALCQQVLSEDGEGPLAGTLGQSPVCGDQDRGGIYAEMIRLVHGDILTSIPSSSVIADAGAMALKLQQVLAEREEAFWVERQRLSDRVMALERARGGRTGALMRAYETTAKGSPGGTGGAAAGPGTGTGVAAAAGAAAGAVTEVASAGWRRLRETVGA